MIQALRENSQCDESSTAVTITRAEVDEPAGQREPGSGDMDTTAGLDVSQVKQPPVVCKSCHTRAAGSVVHGRRRARFELRTWTKNEKTSQRDS
jgi:hypothetical protein